MQDDFTAVNRRVLFAAGGLGAVAALGLIGRAEAAPTEETKANIKAVADFCNLWGDAKPDPEKIAAMLSDDCVVNLNQTKPPLIGRAAALETIKAIVTGGGGRQIIMKLGETHAIGPVVLHYRTDTVVSQGKTGKPLPLVATFGLNKDGKIRDWADYVVPAKT